jgi:23S rRNA (uracil1939-C5)-methyltransferase
VPADVPAHGLIDLAVERPVAGGRMLARHRGRIVFVSGAIPGERVRARIERVTRHGTWAAVVEVVEASPDRRDPPCDPLCGGLAFAHIRYERQRRLKSEILVDALRRLGRQTLDPAPDVAASPETAYRLRARLHVRDGRIGFYREGSHDICDAAPTGQLAPAAIDAARALVEQAGTHAVNLAGLTIAENFAGTERVMHLEPSPGAPARSLEASLALVPGATGITIAVGARLRVVAGMPTVTDTADQLFGAAPPIDGHVKWSRHPTSFFQGNRFLTGALVRRVLELSNGERFADLYAGVGLFAVALAALGGRVMAVEGDQSSSRDLEVNSRPWRERLRAVHAAVEHVLADAPDPAPDAVVLDPPRTGVSAAAIGGLIRWGAPRLVYVSCDPPTLARDIARLVDAGYRLTSVDGFDLFPNTPHVEAVAVLDR